MAGKQAKKEDVTETIGRILDKQTHEKGLIPPDVMAYLRNQPAGR